MSNDGYYAPYGSDYSGTNNMYGGYGNDHSDMGSPNYGYGMNSGYGNSGTYYSDGYSYKDSSQYSNYGGYFPCDSRCYVAASDPHTATVSAAFHTPPRITTEPASAIWATWVMTARTEPTANAIQSVTDVLVPMPVIASSVPITRT
jgi:hypothetical protein